MNCLSVSYLVLLLACLCLTSERTADAQTQRFSPGDKVDVAFKLMLGSPKPNAAYFASN